MKMDTIDSFNGKYRFLSNFSDYPCLFEGINYKTVEHAFQAAKTLDIKQRMKIAEVVTPGEAKKLGRRVCLRKDWEQVKDAIMYDCLVSKFKLDKVLRLKLLDTYPAELIEGNTWGDTYWGVCNGAGKNMLGKLLMKLRDEMKQEINIDSKITVDK